METPLDKQPAQIAAMFDAIAARYDRLNRLLSVGLDERWRARAVRSLALRGSETVLDLCTGTADLALAAARRPAQAEAGRYDRSEPRSGAARVIGVDFAHQMLRQAQPKLRRDGGVPVRLVRGDAARIPIRSSSIDAVTIGFGIRNVQDVRAALQEIHRVLRPGGRLAILEFAIPQAPVIRACYLWYFRRVLPRIGRAISRHATAYSYLPASVGAFARPEELSALLRSAGFERVDALPLTMGVVHLHVAVKPSGVV